MRTGRLMPAALLALAAWLPGGAAVAGPEMVVVDAWARATPGRARNGAAYMTVRNDGDAADRLVSVQTPAAARAELHDHMVDGGVMRMRPVGAIEVRPGEPAVLRPGGLHVMLMGLAAPLGQGQTISLTLGFETSGTRTVEVPVLGVGAGGPAGGRGQGQGHGQGGHGRMKTN